MEIYLYVIQDNCSLVNLTSGRLNFHSETLSWLPTHHIASSGPSAWCHYVSLSPEEKRKLHQNEQGLSPSPFGFHGEAIYVHSPPVAHWEVAEDQLLQMDSMSGLSPLFHILNCHCVKCLVIKYGAARKLQLYLSVFFSDLWISFSLQRIPPGGSENMCHPNQ